MLLVLILSCRHFGTRPIHSNKSILPTGETQHAEVINSLLLKQTLSLELHSTIRGNDTACGPR